MLDEAGIAGAAKAIGALVIVPVRNGLSNLGPWIVVAQGVIFAAIVLSFRRGLIDETANKFKLSL